MTIIIKTADDFLAACQALYPRGRAWDKDPDSNMTLALQALMQNQARIFNDSSNLLIDAFPATTVDLLPQWEASLGLPDPCLGPNPTITQRQQQVVARLTDTGGQSFAYYVAYALALGFEINVTVFRPQLVGVDKIGHFRMYPNQSANWVLINAIPAASLNTVLECEFDEKARVTNDFFFIYNYGTSYDSTPVGTNVSTYDLNSSALTGDSSGNGISDALDWDTAGVNWDSGITWS